MTATMRRAIEVVYAQAALASDSPRPALGRHRPVEEGEDPDQDGGGKGGVAPVVEAPGVDCPAVFAHRETQAQSSSNEGRGLFSPRRKCPLEKSLEWWDIQHSTKSGVSSPGDHDISSITKKRPWAKGKKDTQCHRNHIPVSGVA